MTASRELSLLPGFLHENRLAPTCCYGRAGPYSAFLLQVGGCTGQRGAGLHRPQKAQCLAVRGSPGQAWYGGGGAAGGVHHVNRVAGAATVPLQLQPDTRAKLAGPEEPSRRPHCSSLRPATVPRLQGPGVPGPETLPVPAWGAAGGRAPWEEGRWPPRPRRLGNKGRRPARPRQPSLPLIPKGAVSPPHSSGRGGPRGATAVSKGPTGLQATTAAWAGQGAPRAMRSSRLTAAIHEPGQRLGPGRAQGPASPAGWPLRAAGGGLQQEGRRGGAALRPDVATGAAARPTSLLLHFFKRSVWE